MKVQENTKLTNDLEVGDHIKVGGWIGCITRITNPRSQISLRLSVKIDQRPQVYMSVTFPPEIHVEVLP